MTRRNIILLALLSALSLGSYLVVSHIVYRVGFPLDDAWIHQTYARNLALRGEWAFVPGHPSAGSTGPLWAVLLALGYVLRLAPYLWTYLLGWLLLSGLSILGALIFGYLCLDSERWAFWAGSLLALEWHLVWAAGSGMETLLFAFLVCLVLGILVRIQSRSEAKKLNWLIVGLLSGLSVWVRPGGITLLAPALLVATLLPVSWKRKFQAILLVSAGFAILFGPYLLFNYSIAGSWWPNTFYAKQAEYASHRQIPFWQRWLEQASLPLVGVGVVLLPGFLLFFVRLVRRQNWAGIAGALWGLGYLSMYAWRLPVTYQHGRYIIPMMPIFFLWGFAGLVEFVQRQADVWHWRVLAKTWLITAVIVLLIFWGLGARAYGRDVAVIETEMVAVAHWVAENTPQDALIAAHDIGALGYFADRSLLDLAGLVSPDVIPFIRDESALREYMHTRGAEYLVTFPGWYPALAAHATPEFQTNAPISPSSNHENMAVYQLPLP
ncbi:MAG: hypothetical protein U9Q82_12525 [Chloroflexota bacterium]|nr:hypothetical protein [Chloroflexota bacterium]